MNILRQLTAAAIVSSFLVATCGCAAPESKQEPAMNEPDRPSSAPSPSSATVAWDDLNSVVERTQSVVGGQWEATDTGARPCGRTGAQWVIVRLRPGAFEQARGAVVDRVEALWQDQRWEPVRSKFGTESPGLQLRYPASESFENRFFIEFHITAHGASVQAQTPCAQGDPDALNDERYAYRHQTTTILPSVSPVPDPTG